MRRRTRMPKSSARPSRQPSSHFSVRIENWRGRAGGRIGSVSEGRPGLNDPPDEGTHQCLERHLGRAPAHAGTLEQHRPEVRLVDDLRGRDGVGRGSALKSRVRVSARQTERTLTKLTACSA